MLGAHEGGGGNLPIRNIEFHYENVKFCSKFTKITLQYVLKGVKIS